MTSIDIDPGLIANARQRLAMYHYAPLLATLDGAQGYPVRAPFDRLIATVAVPSVPQEWIVQTSVRGVILLPLDRRNCGGLLVRLTVQASGVARGRFLPDYGGFMPLRQLKRCDAASHAFRSIDDRQGDIRRTGLPADIITHEDSLFEFFAALTVLGGGWNHLTFTPTRRPTSVGASGILITCFVSAQRGKLASYGQETPDTGRSADRGIGPRVGRRAGRHRRDDIVQHG